MFSHTYTFTSWSIFLANPPREFALNSQYRGGSHGYWRCQNLREVAVHGRHSDDQQGNLRGLQRGKGLRLFPSSCEEREGVGIPTCLRTLQSRADPGGQDCPQVRPFLPDRGFPKGSRTAKRLVAQSRLFVGALCQRLPRAAEST